MIPTPVATAVSVQSSWRAHVAPLGYFTPSSSATLRAWLEDRQRRWGLPLANRRAKRASLPAGVTVVGDVSDIERVIRCPTSREGRRWVGRFSEAEVRNALHSYSYISISISL